MFTFAFYNEKKANQHEYSLGLTKGNIVQLKIRPNK